MPYTVQAYLVLAFAIGVEIVAILAHLRVDTARDPPSSSHSGRSRQLSSSHSSKQRYSIRNNVSSSKRCNNNDDNNNRYSKVLTSLHEKDLATLRL